MSQEESAVIKAAKAYAEITEEGRVLAKNHGLSVDQMAAQHKAHIALLDAVAALHAVSSQRATKAFYFTVFLHTAQNGKHQGDTSTTREYAGDTHPFKLKEDLIAKGIFKSSVIVFFKEITEDEFNLFKVMQAQPRPL